MILLSRNFACLIAVTMSVSSVASSANENDGRVAMDKKAAERTMRDFAKCVVDNKKREAKALEFLKVPDGDPKQRMLGTAIAVGGCAPRGSQMRFQPDLFSRAVYTALYGKYFKKSAPENLSIESDSDYSSEYAVSTVPISKSQIVLRAFADCTVRSDASAAHRFVLSEMQSTAEEGSLPPVMSAMQNCLPKGSELRFSRTVLKGLVSESLYKARQKQAKVAVGEPK